MFCQLFVGSAFDVGSHLYQQGLHLVVNVFFLFINQYKIAVVYTLPSICKWPPQISLWQWCKWRPALPAIHFVGILVYWYVSAFRIDNGAI